MLKSKEYINFLLHDIPTFLRMLECRGRYKSEFFKTQTMNRLLKLCVYPRQSAL